MGTPRSLLKTDEGQFAFGMLVALLAIFVLAALSLDTGLWYFAHRDAQNDADAAALAAALELPADDITAAQGQADAILAANGAETTVPGDTACPTSDDHSHIHFEKVNGSTQYNRVTVCTRRQVSGMLASMSGIKFVHISAKSTADAGHVDGGNVMPWAVLAPDPNCNQPGDKCYYDANGNGSYDDLGDCNGADFSVCPFGLTSTRLYAFKTGGGGNTGIIDSCGNGANGYVGCLSGTPTPGAFFSAGGTVVVGLQGGNLGQNTDSGLTSRSPADAWTYPKSTKKNVCDVTATPVPQFKMVSGKKVVTDSPGYDPDGAASALAKFHTSPTIPDCIYRLVLVPILRTLPPNGGGSASLDVLGVATFGLANWNRVSNKDTFGTASSECADGGDSTLGYSCGMVWGYLMSNVNPPQQLLQKIGSSGNPFAPLLIALTN